jgi:hypothetical protein
MVEGDVVFSLSAQGYLGLELDGLKSPEPGQQN